MDDKPKDVPEASAERAIVHPAPGYQMSSTFWPEWARPGIRGARKGNTRKNT